MRKRILLIAFLLVILSISVNARRTENFSADDAYDWLLQQASNGSFNGDIVDTAAAFLALDAAGGLATLEMDYILSQENENHCWPKSGCKIKDTVWAVLAAYKYGETDIVTNSEGWLKKAQTPSLTGGNWWLEIDTPDTGTCIIKYTKGETPVSKNIEVDAGTFPGCGGGTFFDLKNCLEAGLLSSYASLDLDVDCSALSSAKISIAYNSGSSYYLYQEVADNTAIITVKNGCFGTSYKNPSCSYESALYAEWVLNQVDSSLSSELYLKESYDSNNPLHNALLYLVTQDKVYSDELKKSQKSEGSWGSNSLYTAFAILALRSESGFTQYVEKAQEWLKQKQQEDGSWDGKVFNTAMVLYSSFYSGVELPSCSDGIRNQGERGVDCGGPCEESDDCCDNGVKDELEEGIDCDGVCEPCTELICDGDGACEDDRGEDCNNCPEDCMGCEDLCSDGERSAASAEEGDDCGGYCESLFDKACDSVCNSDGECDNDLIDYGYTDNEDSENCDDCWCGDEVCDDYERETGECVKDCGAPPARCGDGTCDEGEDVSCPQDCTEGVCNSDGVCDDDEDCDCSDCWGEDICAEVSEGSGLMWILIIIVVLALGGGAYFFYTKKKGGKPQGPSYASYNRGAGPSFPSRAAPGKPGPKGSFFSGLTKPRQPAAPQGPSLRREVTPVRKKKSKLDEEIEKSIKEAKKLIKGEE